MKFVTSNPVEVSMAVEAMGLGEYMKVPLEYHFPISDVTDFKRCVENAKTDRELQNIQVGNLRTSWVCTIEGEKQNYLSEIRRLCRWLDEGINVGEAIERNFGICCSIGVKFHCQHLHHQYRYDEHLREYPVNNPRRKRA